MSATSNIAYQGDQRLDYGNATGTSLWQSGLTVPDIEMLLFEQFADDRDLFFMSMFFPLVFGSEVSSRRRGRNGVFWNWMEIGKRRYGLTVGSLGSGGSATLTVTTAHACTSTTDCWAIVGQNVNLARSAVQAYVSGVTVSGGFEVLTLKRMDGANWASGGGLAAQISAGDILGLSSTQFGEGTKQPTGKNWYPEWKSNQMTTMKATSSVTGDDMATRTYIPGSGMYYTLNQLTTFKEFQRDRENNFMWAQGVEPGSTAANTNGVPLETRGVVHSILAESNLVGTYSGAVTESDIQAWISTSRLYGASTHFLALAGNTFVMDWQAALVDYSLAGSTTYGSIGEEGQTAGLNFQRYRYGGTLIDLYDYKPFNDRDVTGYAGGASATVFDWRNAALMLNMGAGNATSPEGEVVPYVCQYYREFGNTRRDLVTGYLKGMTGHMNTANDVALGSEFAGLFNQMMGNQVSTDYDKDTWYFLSQEGISVACASTKHGYMRATS